MNFKIFAAILLLLCIGVIKHNTLHKLPFWAEIKEFKKLDNNQFPNSNAILFIGSSSIRKWKDIQQYFPGYPIINRGFGGSSLQDLIRYRDAIIYPYQPKQIVIYCGENDIADNDTISAQTVLSRFQLLFELIRSKYATVPIAFISIKPSQKRIQLSSKFIETNKLIKSYLSTKNKTTYIDIYNQMLNMDGTANKELFISDSLHLNEKGYALWKKNINPYLLK